MYEQQIMEFFVSIMDKTPDNITNFTSITVYVWPAEFEFTKTL